MTHSEGFYSSTCDTPDLLPGYGRERGHGNVIHARNPIFGGNLVSHFRCEVTSEFLSTAFFIRSDRQFPYRN